MPFGLRELLNKNKTVATLVPGVLLVLVAAAVWFQVAGGRRYPPGISDRAYFTTDETLTGQAALDALFIDSVDRVPPFDHKGKPAFRAIVFECNGGRNRWVNTLRRYKADTKKKLEAEYAKLRASGIKTDPHLFNFEGGLEVKRPGSEAWVVRG